MEAYPLRTWTWTKTSERLGRTTVGRRHGLTRVINLRVHAANETKKKWVGYATPKYRPDIVRPSPPPVLGHVSRVTFFVLKKINRFPDAYDYDPRQ